MDDGWHSYPAQRLGEDLQIFGHDYITVDGIYSHASIESTYVQEMFILKRGPSDVYTSEDLEAEYIEHPAFDSPGYMWFTDEPLDEEAWLRYGEIRSL